MTIKGNQLLAWNEITKKFHAAIDLSQAMHLEDCNSDLKDTASDARSRSSHSKSASNKEEEPYTVERSFKITFKDESEVQFFADTDDEKADWLRILSQLVGKAGTEMPLWASLLKDHLDKKADTTATRSASAATRKQQRSSSSSRIASSDMNKPVRPAPRSNTSRVASVPEEGADKIAKRKP